MGVMHSVEAQMLGIASPETEEVGLVFDEHWHRGDVFGNGRSMDLVHLNWIFKLVVSVCLRVHVRDAGTTGENDGNTVFIIKHYGVVQVFKDVVQAIELELVGMSSVVVSVRIFVQDPNSLRVFHSV